MRCVGAALLCAMSVCAWAQDDPPAPKFLTPGPGVEITTARCVMCHDATHITRTKLSRDEWAFNIKNMIERGAPITPAEVAPILEYLSIYYNRDKPPPATQAALQDDAAALATRHACIACHAADKRVLGPSFREMAAKYGPQANVAALVNKVRAGSTGTWGATPMPPNAGVPDADARRLVEWILQHK
jgi:cytochrome c551/c552